MRLRKEISMYADPKRLRDNRLTLRFNDYEHQLVIALANYQGEQLSTLLRQIVMREATALLHSGRYCQCRDGRGRSAGDLAPINSALKQ